MLETFGLSKNVVNWCRNYLQSQEQIVKIDVHLSEPANVTFGVPQGSILGPLFLMYVNGVIDCVPQALQVACHHGDAQTNKPTKRDDRAYPLISPLHNADKASAGHPIG